MSSAPPHASAPHASASPDAGFAAMLSGLSIRSQPAPAPALVDGVALRLRAGEIVCLVGESGCGKSLTALSMLGLVPPQLLVDPSYELRMGDAVARGRDEKAWRPIRGRRVGLVYQNPLSSLNPLAPVGRQVQETIEAHGFARGARAEEKALEMLDSVGLRPAQGVFGLRPHELSGGMRQRVALACALAGRPDVLVADEPTTALDPTVKGELLGLLRALAADRGVAMLVVTHDLGVVAELADRVYAMYAGRVIEQAPVDAFFDCAQHPYVKALLGARPRLGVVPQPIPGHVPPVTQWGDLCRFMDRCSRRVALCDQLAPHLVGTDHAVACHNPHVSGPAESGLVAP